MSYYVSRQVYWPEGQHVVEIAPGIDHASPGQLVAHYKREGEGQEFADPVEAAEAAILVRRAWQKDSKKRIGLTFGDADLGWGAHTQKELLAWAARMQEKAPKCDWCGKVLGSKRGDQWQSHDFPDETFCSERCVEKMLEDQAKFESNTGADNPAIQQNEHLFQDADDRWVVEWRDGSGPWRTLGTRKTRDAAFRLIVAERHRTAYRLNAGRKAVGIHGDVNYLDYGGAVVYDDGSVELIEPGGDEEDPITIYRFDAERRDQAEAEREWFGDDLDKIARSVGTTKAAILRDLASARVLSRVLAYLDIISYWGAREFDSDPLVLTRAEAEKRYAGIDRSSLTPNPSRSQKLKSSTETKAVEKLVRSAAAQRFGRGQAVPVFEHERWWVDVDGRIYAVVDAVPGIARTGLDFEEL